MPRLLVASSLLLGSCVHHRIGPARTAADYLGKARTTAESAQSAVQTVLLLADAASAGRTFSPYTSVSVSEQEDALDGVASGFRSIQPPDRVSDRVRHELDELLVDAAQHVAAVRIEARRGHLDDLERAAEPLRTDARQLDHFLASHP